MRRTVVLLMVVVSWIREKVSLIKTTEAKALPTKTSAQKVELIALICALQLAKGLRINIYADFKYAFLVLQFGRKGYYYQVISPQKWAWNEAVPLPKEADVILLRGHRKDMTLESKGNNLADHVAKQPAQTKQICNLTPGSAPIKSVTPGYSDQETDIAQEWGHSKKIHRTGLLIRETSLFPKIANGR